MKRSLQKNSRIFLVLLKSIISRDSNITPILKRMSGKYNLTWDKISKHFQCMLKELLEEQRYSNVTLVWLNSRPTKLFSVLAVQFLRQSLTRRCSYERTAEFMKVAKDLEVKEIGNVQLKNEDDYEKRRKSQKKR